MSIIDVNMRMSRVFSRIATGFIFTIALLFLWEVYYHVSVNEGAVKDLICEYFSFGYTHRQIHYILEERHGVQISFSYFTRKIMSSIGLYRRGQRALSPLHVIVRAVMAELDAGPGQCAGIQQMLMILRTKYGVRVTRDILREIMQILDPINIARRRRNRLLRRQYRSKGPNYLWHMDGYDKLSRFGLCIHGCIDGFSRYIIWLEVGVTNHKPDVVASYFMNAVDTLSGCPKRIRCDRGTENVKVGSIQTLLTGRDDSIIFGPSTSNQRIEQWWSNLRKQRCDWWIQHFRDLESNGDIAVDNKVHIMCLQFAYMTLIRRELNEVRYRWNHHRIRRQRQGDVVSGIPDMLYHNPEILGEPDCHSYLDGVDVTTPLAQLCRDTYCMYDSNIDEDFVIVATEIATANRWNINPTTPADAKELYLQLKSQMEQII